MPRNGAIIARSSGMIVMRSIEARLCLKGSIHGVIIINNSLNDEVYSDGCRVSRLDSKNSRVGSDGKIDKGKIR